MQEDLHLPYILGFRAAHYFVVWCNPPLLRTAFFAALDGTVLVAVDGFDDMNLNGSLDTGNYVVIDHGGGFETSYWHMAKNSVAVSVGQDVSAGTQVGRAGSSGNSFGPHLHFETQDAFVPVEPHVGPCNAAPTASWESEPSFDLDAYVWDFGASRTDAFASPLTIFPHEPIKDSQHALSDSHVYFWIRMSNLPIGSTWDVNWYRPDGQLVWDGFVVPFGNTELFVEYWTGWAYDFPELHTIAGTWRLELLINGEVVVDAPIEIVATIDPAFNRPPEPITVALDPAEPTAGDTPFARVTADLIEDDLDWDIVRFRYEWDVQGTTVRDVTTAAHSDAIPHDAALPGERITCTVTPSDGKVGGTGTPVSASAVLEPSPWTDLGFALGGTLGDPSLEATGSLVPGKPIEIAMTNALPSTGLVLFVGLAELNFSPFYGGTLVPDPNPPGLLVVLVSNGAGEVVLPSLWPAAVPPGFTVWLQYFFEDLGAPFGGAGSNAVRGVTQ